MIADNFVEGEVIVKVCGVEVESTLEALRVEVNQPQPEKGKVTILKEDNCIKLIIHSKDLSGLRALTNSFLYLLFAASSTIEKLEPSEL